MAQIKFNVIDSTNVHAYFENCDLKIQLKAKKNLLSLGSVLGLELGIALVMDSAAHVHTRTSFKLSVDNFYPPKDCHDYMCLHVLRTGSLKGHCYFFSRIHKHMEINARAGRGLCKE